MAILVILHQEMFMRDFCAYLLAWGQKERLFMAQVMSIPPFEKLITSRRAAARENKTQASCVVHGPRTLQY